MVSIRGATTIKDNSVSEILENTKVLLIELIRLNNLERDKIISIFFSCTGDVTAAYPAQAARELGLNNTSLMCLQEMYVDGSLELCIRVCVFYNDNIEQAIIKNVYLKEAASLRPDWTIPKKL